MKLLVFAFKGTAAEKVLAALTIQCEKILLGSSENDIDYFFTSNNLGKYTHILGLEAYSGRDTDKLRIETQCTSQFRNKSKLNREVIDINPFFTPAKNFKHSNGIGNSWCNLVSYRIVKKEHAYQYTFLHIPKSYDASNAVNVIENQISSKLSPR